MGQVTRYPLTYDSTPLDLLQAVVVDLTGNGGARSAPLFGPDRAPIEQLGVIFTDSSGNPYNFAAAWGTITGTLSAQTDLQNALNAKANLAGGNTFVNAQIFDGGAVSNFSPVALSNLGGGLVGYQLNYAGMGSVYFGSLTSNTVTIGTTNHCQLFWANGAAYDSAAQAFEFRNDTGTGKHLMMLRHASGNTNDFLRALDFSNNVEIRLRGDGGADFTGLVNTAASATGTAGLNVPHGVAPTTPNNGDLWTTTAGLFARINGATVGPFGTGGGTTTNAVTFNSSGGAAPGTTFNGSVARTIDYSSVGATRAGLITSGDLTIGTGKLAGRTTAATGAIESIGVDATMSLTALTLGVAKVPNAVTFAISGGSAAGAYDGSAAKTVDFSTVGAHPLNPQGQSAASGTLTPTFSDDFCNRTGLTAALTINNWTGTAQDFWTMIIRLKDNGTARAITYGTNYLAVDGVTLPTTTTVGKTHELTFTHNSTTGKHMCTSAVTY